MTYLLLIPPQTFNEVTFMTYEAVNNIPFIKDVIITCTYIMYVPV